MFNRRNFLEASILSSASLFFSRSFAAMSGEQRPNIEKPIVISTWDFGQAANIEAWKTLAKGGNVIDAVEDGVKVPEADENNHTVGIGGYPDRDGKVTLDACIMVAI
jgi:N4-(beta-N-acetylglucosaminyl)-L-asparaginase